MVYERMMMRWLVLSVVVACGSTRVAMPHGPPPPPEQPAEPPPTTSCPPGQFIDDVTGGVTNPDGSHSHSDDCRPLPEACVATPTCDCMKKLGLDMCSDDGHGLLRIIELRPSAAPRN